MTPADARQKNFPAVAVGIGVVTALAAAVLVVLLSRSPTRTVVSSVASGEAKAYVKNLELANVSMNASESFMHQKLVEVQGQITNRGNRPLKSVEVFCLFYSPAGQEIRRERSAIVAAKTSPLAPGQSRTFRLPFDTLPDGWNQAVPRMVIASIVFAE